MSFITTPVRFRDGATIFRRFADLISPHYIGEHGVIDASHATSGFGDDLIL